MGEGGFARLRAGQVGGKTCPRHVFWHASPSNPRFTKTHTKQKHHPQDGGRWIRPPAGGPPRGSDMPPACHSLPLGFESTLHKDPYQTQDPSSRMGLVFGGGRWIRTTEGIASRFTVCPLWLSPLATREFPHIRLLTVRWSWWTDSNPRPADYKSAALPAELHQHIRSARQPAYNSKYSFICQ